MQDKKMKVQVQVECPGCKMGKINIFRLRRPSILQPSLFQFRCPECHSSVMAKFEAYKKKDNVPKGNMKVSFKILEESAILKQLRQEEQDLKNEVAAENA